MSLVVCSNQDSDSTTATNQSSIYKPYSFRNALSSTYMIPKNAQVALQSCKYNLDGTIPLSGADQVLYQYYGHDLDEETSTTPAEDIEVKSAAVPIRTQIFSGRKDTIQEVSADDLAKSVEEAMNKRIFHPNLRDLVDVAVKRDGTTNEFEGYDINYGQYATGTSVLPTDDEVIDQMSDELKSGNEYPNFHYEEGQFTALASPAIDAPAVAVLASNPLSAQGGVLHVDFSDPNDNARDWGIGLSRYVNTALPDSSTGTNVRRPYYAIKSDATTDHTQPDDNFFFDYIVCRKEGVLKVYHTCADSEVRDTFGGTNLIIPRELEYGDHDVSFDYDLDTNPSNYVGVKFVLVGQRFSIIMVRNNGNENLLYEYDKSLVNTHNLSCVSQAKWNLYPLLYIEKGEGLATAMYIEEYTPCQNELQTLRQRLEDENPYEVSWFNSLEGTSDEGVASSLENREWNNYAAEEIWQTYMVWAEVDTAIDLENYLIMTPNSQFAPSTGANTEKLLGFLGTPTKDYVADGLNRTFSSSSVPRLLASRSMFVRLENMTQNSLNARVGNRSSIIAHLPRFDGQVETGRIYHEPSNLIFLDLNNSQPMRVSSFDISFVYSNEQFVEALTGQSVVCLYFKSRDDPAP